VTLLYPQKLALTSPTGGGRSVGIVRSRTKAMEFSFFSTFVPIFGSYLTMALDVIWRIISVHLKESRQTTVISLSGSK
jgi:hypothetical protein